MFCSDIFNIICTWLEMGDSILFALCFKIHYEERVMQKGKLSLTKNICENPHIVRYITDTFNIYISTAVIDKITKYGSVECLKYIIKNGIDIHTKPWGHIVVKSAIKNGNAECLKYIVSTELDNAYNVEWVYDAVTKGHLNCLKYMIESGRVYVTPNGIIETNTYATYFDTNCILIDEDIIHDVEYECAYLAAEYGHLNCLTYIIEKGLDWDNVECACIAVISGNLECLKYIVENSTESGVLTIKNNRSKCLQYLIENGRETDKEIQITLLNEQSRVQCLEYLETLQNNTKF
jgi:hypothetical protein